AEAPALNEILAAPPTAFGSAGQRATLREAVLALGGRPGGPYFVKFSSWNVLYFPLVRAAFPGVPWVFVYRHPVDVMVANLAKPGSWMRAQAAALSAPSAAAAVTGLDPAQVA